MKPWLSKVMEDYRAELCASLDAHSLLIEGRKSTIKDNGHRTLVFSKEDEDQVDNQDSSSKKLIFLLELMTHKPDKVFDWLMSYLVGTGFRDMATDMRGAVGDPGSASDSLTHDDVIAAMKSFYKDSGEILQDTHATASYLLPEVFVQINVLNTKANPGLENVEGAMEYTALLTALKNEVRAFYRIMVVTGNPGCGKTVVAQKIAYDWAEGNNTYKMVILVSLGQLCATSRSADKDFEHASIFDAAIDEFLKYPTYFPYKKDNLHRVLSEYCEQNRDDVLFICDGYDEYHAGYIQQMDAINKHRVKDRMKMDLPPMRSSLLITSRPLYADHLDVGYRFSLMHFDEAQQSNFVKSFFKDPKIKKKETNVVLKSLKLNPRLANLAKVPMMLSMVCHMVLNTPNKSQLSQLDMMCHINTNASIYEKYCEFLVRRWKTQRVLVEPVNEYYDQIKEFDDIPAKEVLYKLCYRYLSNEVPSQTIKDWINDIRSSIWFNIGVIVCSRSILVKPQVPDGIPLTFVHRSFAEYFASKELIRMVNEDILWNILSLVEMGNSTTADQLPPLCKFLHRFKYSTSFRYDVNQVVEFAYDMLDPARRQGLRSALTFEPKSNITKNVEYLTDTSIRQRLTAHEIMLDIDFKCRAHFCSKKSCKFKTDQNLPVNSNSTLSQACFYGARSLVQWEHLETNSFVDIVLVTKLENLSLVKIKWQMLQLLRVTKKMLYIVIDIDNYNQETAIKLNQFSEKLNDAIVQEQQERDPQFYHMSVEQKRRYDISGHGVGLYLLCLGRNQTLLDVKCLSLLRNINLLSINGINITTDEVEKIMKYTNLENNRAMFDLHLTRNGFCEDSGVNDSKNDYIRISKFIERNKHIWKHSMLKLKFEAESSLVYSTMKRCLELIWNEYNHQDRLIFHHYDATNIDLTNATNLQELCEIITSKVVNSVGNSLIDQFIGITMKRCSLTDFDSCKVHITGMMESIITKARNQDVNIVKLQLNLLHNNFSYSDEQQLLEHALRFKYELLL